jgi:hypothetical protein
MLIVVVIGHHFGLTFTVIVDAVSIEVAASADFCPYSFLETISSWVVDIGRTGGQTTINVQWTD